LTKNWLYQYIAYVSIFVNSPYYQRTELFPVDL